MSDYAFNHCFGVDKNWSKQSNKNGQIHDASLSAARSVRKFAQKNTKNKKSSSKLEIEAKSDPVLLCYGSKSLDSVFVNNQSINVTFAKSGSSIKCFFKGKRHCKIRENESFHHR